MNTKIKAVFFFLLTGFCIYGIHLSVLEIRQGDLYIWGLSPNPPREWLLFLGGPCILILLCIFGWASGQLLKWIVARHYGLD